MANTTTIACFTREGDKLCPILKTEALQDIVEKFSGICTVIWDGLIKYAEKGV